LSDISLAIAANVKPILSGFLVLALLTSLILRWRQPEAPVEPRKVDVLFGVLLVAYALLLLALGIRHQGLADYSVEWDFSGYWLRSQNLSAAFSVNPRTPFGYPLALWLLTLLTRDAFVSAKILAGMSAVASLGLVYLLGRRLFDAYVGLLAALVVLVTPVFAENSMLVGTDMPALACLLGSLYLLFISEGRRRWLIVAAGVLGALSYLIRPSGLVLVPAVVFWLLGLQWTGPSAWQGRRLRTALVYCIAFGVAIFPHLLLNTIHTGNPFYNDRAVDMWLDIYANWDFTQMPKVAGITLGQVIRMDPLRFVTNWTRNLVETIKNPPFPWPVALFVVPGVLALPFRSRRVELGLFYWFGLGHLVLVSTAWSTAKLVRIFLPLMPLLALIAVWLFCELMPFSFRLGRVRLPWREPLLLVGLLVVLWSKPYYSPFLEPGIERLHSFVRPAIESPVDADLAGKARLLGYAVQSKVLHPGDTLELTLYWQAGLPGTRDYTVFVHAIDPTGHMWAGQDNWPVQGTSPTSRWMAGEYVTDRYEIPLPADITPGDYLIEVGMYLLETMERLDVIGADGQPHGNSVVFSGFQVQSP
jgi:4-amino-4-deoxy-L-arabinose transferase-like glycosyltransferase